MNFQTNRRGFALVSMWTIGGRLFNTALLDSKSSANASWISILIALVLSAPSLLSMILISKTHRSASTAAVLDAGCGPVLRKVLSLFTCAFMMLEAAYQVRILVMGAQYIAFDLAPAYLLALITVATGCLACLCGGLSIVSAGKMILVPYFLSIGVLLAMQLGNANPRWLTPILGYGMPALMRQAMEFAGSFTFLIAVWLCLGEETGQDRSGGQSYKPTSPYLMLNIATLGTVLAVLLCLLVATLIPVMPSSPNERDLVLDMLMANGRANITYQLPVIIAWFAHSLTSFTMYLFVSASLLCGSIPKIKPWLGVLIISGLVFVLTLTNMASRNMIEPLAWIRYLFLTLALLATGLVYLIRGKVKRNAPQKAT